MVINVPVTTYTAEDGLRVMSYLGLPLNDTEKGIFRSEFPRLCDTSNRYDLFGTLWEIYAQMLPFRAYPTDTVDQQRQAMLMHTSRDTELCARYKEKLEPKLAQGIPLNEIIGE